MRGRAVGRYLRRFGRDHVFRAVVVGTLAITAAVFATRSTYEPRKNNGGDRHPEQSTASQVQGDGLFGISPDAWTAIFTGVLTAVTSILAGTAFVQIRYLVRADENARATLIASQRAWIKITEVKIVKPLRISDTGGQIAVSLRLSNVGNIPATLIAPWIRLGGIHADSSYIDAFHKSCDDIVTCPPPSNIALFPGDDFPSGSEHVTYIAYMDEEEMGKSSFYIDGEKYFYPILLICVLYQFATDKGKYHQTREILEVTGVDIEGVAIKQGVVPIGNLSIRGSARNSNLYVD